MPRLRFLVGALLLLHASAARAANQHVEFTTTLGAFVAELCAEVSPQCGGAAPVTVANFLKYVDGNLFPATTFIDARNPGAALPYFQGGAYYYNSTSESVGSVPPLHLVPRERSPGLSNVRGSLSMIYEGNLKGVASWWFVNLADNESLDTAKGDYPVIGQIVSGMDVVDAIGALPLYPPPDGDLPLIDYPGEPALEFPYLVYVTSTERVPEPSGAALGLAALAPLAWLARRPYPAAP